MTPLEYLNRMIEALNRLTPEQLSKLVKKTPINRKSAQGSAQIERRIRRVQ